jgi:glycosyltransferase involved in cell wall biosynthesis
MKNADVSVVIPCFNCAETIERAVHSVTQQTLRPAEVILINDASTDNTLEILAKMVEGDADFIKVIDFKANQGVASARNAGWDIANQSYIAFLDADDAWHKQKIEIQYNLMLSQPDIVLCGHICEVSKNKIIGNVNFHKSMVKTISSQKFLFSNPFSTPSVMLKNGIPFRFDSTKRYAEDYFLWLQIALSQGKVHKIELSLAYLFKAKFGESGLSSHIWQMEAGELNNYFLLFKTNKISAFLFFRISRFNIPEIIASQLDVNISSRRNTYS